MLTLGNDFVSFSNKVFQDFFKLKKQNLCKSEFLEIETD